MDVWIMDTCIIDKWGAGHGHWGTGNLCGSHGLKGVKHKVKRPELRRTSNKMSSPNRASRLQYYHIVVFVRGRGKGEREKEWKAGKCGNCGERGEGMITSLMQERKWLMSLLISAISHFRPALLSTLKEAHGVINERWSVWSRQQDEKDDVFFV